MKWLKILLGIAVSVGCLYYALYDVIHDPEQREQFQIAVKHANYVALIPILSIVFVFYWLKAIRWKWLLSPLGQYRPLRDLFPPIMIGFAWNNVLPMHLGEFIRMEVFSRKSGLPRAAVLSSIVTERLFDIIAIVFCFGTGVLLEYAHPDTSSPQAVVQTVAGAPAKSSEIDARAAAGKKSVLLGIVAAAVMVGSLVFVFRTNDILRIIHWGLKLLRIPTALESKISDLLTTAANGLSSLRSFRTVSAILAISLVKWGLNGLVIYMALLAYGVHLSLAKAFILLGVVAGGVTLPAAPGYFGIMQVCFRSVLGNTPAVIAASFFYQLSQYFPVTGTGLFFFFRTGMTLSESTSSPTSPPAVSAISESAQ